MTEETETQPREKAVTRGEWIALAALAISIGTSLFSFGVMYGNVQQNTRLNAEQEIKLDELIPGMARIEEKLDFVVEAERERRRMERD